MIENEDYIIAQDPESTDESEWIVIINKGEWSDFIIKYLNLRIVDEGQNISYDLEVILVPEKLRDTTPTEEQQDAFTDHCSDLIRHIVSEFHDQKLSVYVDAVTGEKIEY